MSRLSAAVLLASLCPGLLLAAEQPKPPSSFTQAAQEQVRQSLPFNDRADFERVEKGLIKRPDNLVIKNDDGTIAEW